MVIIKTQEYKTTKNNTGTGLLGINYKNKTFSGFKFTLSFNKLNTRIKDV